MRIGVVLPQTELGGDVNAVREYATAADELGFRHLVAYDHVVGADPKVHAPWNGPYDVSTTFHEPFVLFGYLAAITKLELVTAIIILPQRQTALVAKQATEVDLLTGGRFRFGVGVGWNKVEFDALDQPFERRGARMDEQIALLRQMWTEQSVTFDGTFDRIHGAGLAPMPIQQPIPLWIGGSSEPAYRRMGRLADGWFPQVAPGEKLDAALQIIRRAAEEAGRDPSAIGMEGRVVWDPQHPADFVKQVEQWRAAGATHLGVNTMKLGLGGAAGHVAALRQVAELIELT